MAQKSTEQFDADDATAIARLRAAQATNRARRRALWQRIYQFVDGLFHINGNDFIAFGKTSAKWTLLGGSVGVLAGVASAIFLISLAWATEVRVANIQIIFLLPLMGFLVAWVYARFGGTAALGNNLVIDEVNRNRSKIPLRMAPLVLLGTVITHLFGGSAGREGTAIQMGASLADGLRRLLRLGPDDRRLLIMAGISGGFGSVFGVPVAGFAFGMEVQSVGRMRYEGIIPCMAAAYVGDLVTRVLGAPHSHYPALINRAIEPVLLLQVIIAGVLFGLTSLFFIELTHGVKYLMRRITPWTPLYPMFGGFAVLGLTYLVGSTDYLGLSLPLIHDSLDGTGVVAFAFLLKLIFTAVTLGTGYLGGEVTPLFVVGSTLGYTLGGLLGVDPILLASIGMVAVFAGASNTPLACAIMGIELFGGGSALYLFLGCVVAYLASGHRGIYTTQPIGTPKSLGMDVLDGENLGALAQRRGAGWLPPLAGLTGKVAQTPVWAFMTQPVITVRGETRVDEVVTTALGGGVRTVPVVNGQEAIIGIVTDHDLRRSGIDCSLSLLKNMGNGERALVLAGLHNWQAHDVMSAPVATVTHRTPLLDVLKQMKLQRLKRLPVVDDSGRLAGIVTRSDVLRQIAFADPVLLLAGDVDFDWSVKVGDLDLQPCTTVTEEASVAAVIRQMREQGQKRAVVLDGSGKVAGFVTADDLLEHASDTAERAAILHMWQTGEQIDERLMQPVARFATSPVMTISAESKAIDAVRLLIQNGIKRLPVLDENGQVIGLIGRDGLLRGILKV
jgi:H+/Cl- antiporter ClcA/CBS-domain-containing membrane protein